MNCKHVSLVRLPQHNVIVDELHLLLRVTDRLTENLIKECLELDVIKKIGNLAKCLANPESHLNRLIASVRSCGVSFEIWETQLSSGKVLGTLSVPALLGKKRKNFSSHYLLVNRVLISETESVVVQIWRESAKVYRSIVNFTCDDGNVVEEGIFKIAREWVLLFLSLEGKRTGYERQRITPHIHILIYHNTSYLFTAQWFEKCQCAGDGEAK